MDINVFHRRSLPTLAALLLACAVVGCPASKPPPPAVGDVSRAGPGVAQAVDDKPGTITKMLRAIGIGKKPVPKPTSQTLPLRIFTADNLNAGTSRDPLP